MKVGIKILPRQEVLDSQGRAVHKTLEHHGFSLGDCRVGKYVELEVQAPSKEDALTQAKKIAEFVLYNPLIENYEMEVL